MAKSSKSTLKSSNGVIEVKSKFDAEFRRFSVDVSNSSLLKYLEFHTLLETLHALTATPFIITYIDPVHGDSLPINNDDNFTKALTTARPLLRVMVQKREDCPEVMSGYGSLPMKKRNPIISKLISSEPPPRPRIKISMPEDFRRVSAIIDIDIVPEAHRRVKLMKNGSEKPLGFYIRDGSIIAYSNSKMEKFPGIFISRLVPGGLAESTGLLAVNDEVLEVNGIEVSGKTLDQVTDMMVANSANLIITVKPANQKLTLSQERGLPQRQSQMSHISATSIHSQQSSKSYDSDTVIEHDEEDEVNDLVTPEGDKEATEDASLLTL